MESGRLPIRSKDIAIAALTLALLAVLLLLFLRPAEPARDIVFGDLGRRQVASNAVTERQPGATPGAPGNPAPAGGQMGTNAPSSREPGQDQSDQTAGHTASVPPAARPGPGAAPDVASNSPPENNPAASSSPSSNQAPLTPAPALPPA